MSKKSNQPVKKLQLNREVLRTLNSETLGEVQGGVSVVTLSAVCTAGQRCLTLHCTATIK
jgi:hypothetical protein